MPKQLMEGKRINAFAVAPEDITIVDKAWLQKHGLTTHHLYDERAEWEPPEEFIRNIMACGVRQAVLITKEGDEFLCVDGRQRLRGARIASQRLIAMGEPPLTVRVMAEKGDEETLMSFMIATNKHRFDDGILIDAAKATRYLEMCNHDYNKAAVAFGVSGMTIRRWEKLHTLSSKAKKAVEAGKISADAAVKTLADLPVSEQNEKVDELIAEAEKTGKRVTTKKAKKKLSKDTSEDAKRPSRDLLKRMIVYSSSLPNKEQILLQWVVGEINLVTAKAHMPWLANAIAEAERGK